ncbi:MAG: Zn-ribbon domain-containing OB-fold protein [Deltaproteobacteria bacterium]|nr:Zn-ribbon domain-containing OB-fold protein [Deltaproteobacteria bacterium]MBW2123080.1 Zn-ribbon domain-containing OB-fold protein [Deltaproteobacteria bacterium]
MGFEEFGTVSFVSQTKVDGFVHRLRQGKVSGSRCRQCGTTYFPPRADCCACMSSEMDWFDVVGEGKLVSYSTLSYAPTGFERDLPYTIGLVRFPGEVQVFGRLSKSIEPGQVAVDMALLVRPVMLPGNRISYEFVKP